MKWGALFMHLENRTANRTWMLDMLMTITAGDHEYFAKNFRPTSLRH